MDQHHNENFEVLQSITTENLVKSLRAKGHNKVKLGLTDVDGLLRGKVISLNKLQSALEKGLGFCNVIFGWDMNDVCYERSDVKFTGEHTGFPDSHMKLDPQTLRFIPWEEDTPFLLGDFYDEEDTNKALALCPRNILKNVKAQAEAQGFQAFFSQEFEWFNFKSPTHPQSTSPTKEASQGFPLKEGLSPGEPLTNGMFGYSLFRSSQNSAYFNELFDYLEAFKIPLEGLHTETGPGVFEAAITYSDILEAADRASLFKLSVRQIAHRHHITPTFMAKWHSELPGCSGHIHQSLWRDGKNAFYDGAQWGNSDTGKAPMSELMESYVAGVLTTLPQMLLMYAPTVNSYKRFVPGSWAPVKADWGLDNRTTALRVIPPMNSSEKTGSSMRLENRVAGSDTNPYLAMACSLASGLWGIEKGLKLKDVPTDVPFSNNLASATAQFEKSELAHKFFGEVFVQHFSATRKWEWELYQNSISDWEKKRYFEIM